MIPFAWLLHGKAPFIQRCSYFLFHHLCPQYNWSHSRFCSMTMVPLSFTLGTYRLTPWFCPRGSLPIPLKTAWNTASDSMTTWVQMKWFLNIIPARQGLMTQSEVLNIDPRSHAVSKPFSQVSRQPLSTLWIEKTTKHLYACFGAAGNPKLCSTGMASRLHTAGFMGLRFS